MGALSLERLEFDTANPNDGPNIGSYLRAGSDGDLISSTNTGSKEALDVNIAASDIQLTVDLDLNDPLVGDGEVDTEDPLKAGSHAYDQASVWSSVDAGDKANQASDLYRRILVNDAPNIGIAANAVSVDNIGVNLSATPQAGRTRMMIQNNGDKSIFVGPSGVTTSSGLEIGKGSTMSIEIGEAIDLYAIVASGTEDVRVLEFA